MWFNAVNVHRALSYYSSPRVQDSTPRFTVHAVFGVSCHLDDELAIENAQHAKYSWRRSCAREEKRRQDPSTFT